MTAVCEHYEHHLARYYAWISGGVELKIKENQKFFIDTYLLLGWLLVLMPASLHARYVIIMVPFLCFYPAAGWLLFSCMVTLSYLKYVTPSRTMPTSVLLLEYGLLFVLLAGGYLSRWITNQNHETHVVLKQKQRYFL